MWFIEYISRYIYLLSFFEYLLVVIFISLVYLFFRILCLKMSQKVWHIISLCLLFIYTLIIFYKVILSRQTETVEREIDIIPLHSYYKFFLGDNPEAFLTNRANALLFFPFGIFLYETIKSKKIFVVLVVALCFSLLVEIMQYAFALGLSEVDDVIHNTLGALLGAFVHVVYEKRLVLLNGWCRILNAFKKSK